jgi:hypothetical protein
MTEERGRWRNKCSDPFVDSWTRRGERSRHEKLRRMLFELAFSGSHNNLIEQMPFLMRTDDFDDLEEENQGGCKKRRLDGAHRL